METQGNPLTELRSQKGGALVELAMVSFVLLMLVGGAIEYGLALHSSQIVHNAGREGARIAATLVDLEENDARAKDAIMYRLENVPFASYLSFDAQDISVSEPTVRVDVKNTDGETCSQEVTVGMDINFEFIILRAFGFSNMNLGTSTTMRYQRQPICD